MSSKSKAQTKGKQGSSGPSTLSTSYLILFNLVSTLSWAYILFTTISLLLSPVPSLISSSTTLPSLTQIHHRASRLPSLAPDLPQHLFLVQLIAILEPFHTLLRLVPSPLLTTVLQISSRLTVVSLLVLIPESARSVAIVGCILAWGPTECIRYPFYALRLLGAKVGPLEWLRYSAFYVLYPLGAISEMGVMYKAWEGTKNGSKRQFGRTEIANGVEVADALLAAGFVIWPVGLYVMMGFMHKQRTKWARSTAKGKAKSS